MNCERCGKFIIVPERCGYCEKLICRECEKSAKRIGKIKRMVICRGCWGDLKKRKKFKSV